jgi:limonene-1,2-epoxide hydrolase
LKQLRFCDIRDIFVEEVFTVNATIIIIPFLVFVGISIGGMCLGEESGPVIIVDNYYQSLKNGDFKRAYQLISKSDRHHTSLARFEGQEDSSHEMRRKFWSLVTWKIEGSRISSDKGKVLVTLNMPNIGEVLGKIVGSTLATIETFGGGKEAVESMTSGILVGLNREDIDYLSVNEQVDLIYEEGEWRLFFNWQDEEKVRMGIICTVGVFT